MLVEEPRDGERVGHDAGHVRRGREAADPERPVRVALQLLGQLGEVRVAVPVLPDRDHVRDRLPPRQLVAVVLVGPDEHDRPLVRRDPRAEIPAVVEVRRETQPEDVNQAVDGGRGPRPAEDHRVPRRVAAHALEDETSCLLAEPGRLEAGAGALGVRVRVQRQHRVPDVVLEERQAAPRGRVVRVGHAPDAVRPGDRLVVADDRGADEVDQGVGPGHVHQASSLWDAGSGAGLDPVGGVSCPPVQSPSCPATTPSTMPTPCSRSWRRSSSACAGSGTSWSVSATPTGTGRSRSTAGPGGEAPESDP